MSKLNRNKRDHSFKKTHLFDYFEPDKWKDDSYFTDYEHHDHHHHDHDGKGHKCSCAYPKCKKRDESKKHGKCCKHNCSKPDLNKYSRCSKPHYCNCCKPSCHHSSHKKQNHHCCNHHKHKHHKCKHC